MISVILRRTDQLFVQPVSKRTPDTASMLMTLLMTVGMIVMIGGDDVVDDDEDSGDDNDNKDYVLCK